MPDYKKKYMPIVITVYIIICLVALVLGLAKRNANQTQTESSAAEETVPEAFEDTKGSVAEENTSSESDDPLVNAASQFINQPAKAEPPSGDMTSVLIAVASVCFGIWLANRRKERGKDSPSVFELLFTRRKK